MRHALYWNRLTIADFTSPFTFFQSIPQSSPFQFHFFPVTTLYRFLMPRQKELEKLEMGDGVIPINRFGPQ
jgi:hypothetical protein